jgi:hypothetical protein
VCVYACINGQLISLLFNFRLHYHITCYVSNLGKLSVVAFLKFYFDLRYLNEYEVTK